MKNKLIYTIITLLIITIITMWTMILFSGKSNREINTTNISEQKIADNVINNIAENKIDEDLEDWKKNQIQNYKYATNLEFWTWNIVNIDLEAREVELELVPWVTTKMNTYNIWNNIEPLTIRAKKGDKIVVNFKNSLQQETTVHWHWVRVPNSEDWVPWVTQDPIPAWWTYKYEFVVNNSWTFIFHPHKNHSEQIGRWLYWLLIVEDENEPKYDKEFAWVLKDFRVWRKWKLTDDFWNLHDAVHGWRIWNVLTVNNDVNKIVEVNQWDTIRLRLANMSNARIYNLDLSKFDAKVIATDDSIVNNPKKVTELEMWPWERYDLEIKIWDKVEDLQLMDNYFSRYASNKLATIRVVWKQIAEKEIVTPVWDLPDWRDASYTKPDIVIDLGWMWVMWGDKWMMMWMWWDRGWTINDGIFPKTNQPIKLKKWEMYIIRMVNNSSRDHPMHLHWDFFQVVNVNGMKWEFIGWKDTVNVKAKEYIDVAIIPTNAWKWAFHCHILEHADLGMFTTVDVEE